MQASVDILASRARLIDQQHPLTEEVKEELKRLSLAGWIKALIQKKKPGMSHLTTTVKEDGTIRISGLVRSEEEKADFVSYLTSVLETRNIKNEITITSESDYQSSF